MSDLHFQPQGANKMSHQNDGQEVYCVCRTSDISRFMIACEKCDEWYHGDCIHPPMTAKSSKNIEKYYCEACTKIDPNLVITYKPVKERKKSSSTKKALKTPSAKSAAKKAKRPVSPSLSLHSHTSSKSSAISSKANVKVEPGTDSTSGSSKSSTSDDSDNWDAELKLNAARPRLNSVQSDTPTQPKPRCKPGPKPKLDGVNRQRKPSGASSIKSGGPKKSGTKDIKKGPKKPKSPAVLSTAQPVQNSSLSALAPRVSPPKPPRTIKRKAPIIHRANDDEASYGEPEDYPGFDVDALRQCYGLNCRFAAAPYSKYCSDECGRALARARLLHYMPLRLADTGDVEAAATQANNKEMDEVRKKLAQCKTSLETMTANKMGLERLIIAGKMVEPVSEEKERDSEDEADRNLDVHCITCGAPISSKLAIKHFERCFNRVENQTSYGSLHPAPNSIFCDVFNPKNKTYCKRLKVICPEHYKDAFEDTGVCGFPLPDNKHSFSGVFCNSYRKNCTRHPSWERIRRAEIDLEILRTYIKMEELAEQESVLMRTIQARGGIVQNLLNWTTKNEEPTGTSLKIEQDEDIVCD
ncbi:hypothetical protein RvY_01408 [Ramazzottius varieornatus]|uniref:CXXC-type zinc finger protein 1 n=1 Tax=Ramazzottius varieornatus TaxID=947166 RepID=A0A1D1UMA4_RAMVA|nr:hypothetical protein RvY_01408 [Ramazzottius varieornatus]